MKIKESPGRGTLTISISRFTENAYQEMLTPVIALRIWHAI